MIARAALRALMCSAIAASGAWAQVGAPLLGYLNDDGAVRPVYGIAAAATVADPAEGVHFRQAAASPAGDYVLGSSAETGDVMIYAAGGLRHVDGTGGAPDAIAISPGGTAAVLWFASISRAQVLTGLPENAEVRNIDTPFRPSNPAALAVSDDGQWIAGVWSAGSAAFGPHGERMELPVAGRATALAFAAGGHALGAANAEGLYWITGLDGAPSAALLFAAPDESFRAVGLAVTEAPHRLLAADRSGSVLSVDPATRATAAADCHCRPDGLAGLSPGVFQLTGLEGGAVRLFESATGQVLFAPLALVEGDRP